MMNGITRLGEFWKNIRDKREVAKASKGIKSINTIKLMLSVAVGICCVGMGSGKGYAAYVNTVSNNPKGIYNLVNPSGGNLNTGSTYNYLYFGKIPSAPSGSYSTTNKEMYWRVLNTTSNDGSTPALFVLTEYGYPTKREWNSDGGQTYAGSDVQTFLNSTMYGECFSDEEKAAILTTSKTESGNDYPFSNTSTYYYPCALMSQKMFLLSMKEAENHAYGFTDTRSASVFNTNDINRRCKQGVSEGSYTHWWLRSGTSYDIDYVAYVSEYGELVNNASANYQYAVRGALNIKLASVILTSPASGATATASPSLTIESLGTNAPSATAGSSESTSNASKLRIYDESRNGFNAGPSTITQKAGNKITIQYSGASTGSNDYISVLIYNSDKSKVYYGAVKKLSGTLANGVATMTLPSDIPTGNGYTLKVLNEAINGPTYTNYAGYKDITLNITSTGATNTSDTTSPTVNNVYKDADGKYFKITASDSGGLGIVTNTVLTTAFKDITSLGTGGTCNVATTSGTTALRVYDAAGNYSNTTNVKTDSTPPVIDSVTYENGQYVISVTDTDSGIWKIVGNKSNGTTTTFADYST